VIETAAPGAAPLFRVRSLDARLLAGEEAPRLQAFFDANPEYYLAVGDEPPAPDEAAREFADLPPADLPFRQNWMIGVTGAEGRLVAMAHGLGDFIAAHVWHIGLFIVASDLHGTGTARAFYDQLETWMRAQGARWIRLGVVHGNTKGERFWARVGYRQVRERTGIAMGRRVNTVRVLVKPLADEPLEAYLAQVTRDRPGAP
jgi:GNAT superfamily N-acetyltransferase